MFDWIADVFLSAAHVVMVLCLMTLISFSIPCPAESSCTVRDRVGALLARSFDFAHQFMLEVALPFAIHWLDRALAFFSYSLPDSEETAFEEQFKYLIVTSSAITEMPSISPGQTIDPTTPSTSFTMTTSDPNTMLFWPTIAATISLSWMSCYYYLGARLSVFIIHIAAVFIIHRHQRRNRIRKLHCMTLDLLRQVVAQCEKNDLLMNNVLDHVRQLELVLQGTTLAPPATMQSYPAHSSSSSRRANEIKRTVCRELCKQFEKFSSVVEHLNRLSNQANLVRFRDMYNVEELSRIDVRSAKNATDELEHLAIIVYWKRRECMIHLLALDVITVGHDSERADYVQRWEAVLEILSSIFEECKHNIEMLNDILGSSALDDEDQTSFVDADPKVQLLLHRYAALEKHVRSIQAKLLICRQDTKMLSADKASSSFSIERLEDRLGSMDQDMTHMLSQWEETKDAFSFLFNNNDEIGRRSFSQSLPSPPSSPKKPQDLSSHRLSMRASIRASSYLENKRIRARQRLSGVFYKRASFVASPYHYLTSPSSFHDSDSIQSD